MPTKIEYLTHTWNPLAMRCDPVSEACDHCWHLAMAKRLAANPAISLAERNAYAGKGIVLRSNISDMLPKKPGRIGVQFIGVQFMGDLFHEDIPHDIRNQVFEAMTENNQHQYLYLLLTKRPHIALEFDKFRERSWLQYPYSPWGDHVWLGVTAENQKRADERIPTLLSIPAAKRFVSIEPMLGPVDLRKFFTVYDEDFPATVNNVVCMSPGEYHAFKEWKKAAKRSLSWVICGGETGPGARPMHPDWVRSLRDQCQSAGVPFFFKGWGAFKGSAEFMDGIKLAGSERIGRLLDGREWSEFPE